MFSMVFSYNIDLGFEKSLEVTKTFCINYSQFSHFKKNLEHIKKVAFFKPQCYTFLLLPWHPFLSHLEKLPTIRDYHPLHQM